MKCSICLEPATTDDLQLNVDGQVKTVHNDCLVTSITHMATALNRIGHGYVELSNEKAQLQRDDYIRWARSALTLSKWHGILLSKYEAKELKDDF